MERLERRPRDVVDLIVVHCTELPDLATAREYGEIIHYPESKTGNSGHCYVNRDGTVEQWVPLDRIAHHVRGLNRRSVGIELVNRGRWPDWYSTGAQARTEPYPAAQIEALIALLDALRSALPGLAALAGHEDLDREEVPASDDPDRHVRRKRDPGPDFPWERVVPASGLERWTSPPPERER